MQRIVVTGAAGMLGSAVAAALQGKHAALPLRRADVDLAEGSATAACFAALAPASVVHCAAWTDVDGCEADPARARRDNVMATQNVVNAAARCGARLVFFSTDYVFDGRAAHPYGEDDPTAPLNVYGQSKRDGEVAVLRHPGNLVVRTSWLFGPGGRNYVRTMARLLRREQEVRVVQDQVGRPTYTHDLAAALVVLLATPATGIVHVANEGSCSWFELAKAIATRLGTSCRVRPCASHEFPRPARRPAYSVLATDRSRVLGLAPLRPWGQALQSYVESYPDELR